MAGGGVGPDTALLISPAFSGPAAVGKSQPGAWLQSCQHQEAAATCQEAQEYFIKSDPGAGNKTPN